MRAVRRLVPLSRDFATVLGGKGLIPGRLQIGGSWGVNLYTHLASAVFEAPGTEKHFGDGVKTVAVAVASVNLAHAGLLVHR